MTLFAGAVSLRPGEPLPQEFAALLERHLSRHADDRPHLIAGAAHALAHLDLGVLAGAGLLAADDGCISLLAGEPLASAAGALEPRCADLRRLHDDALQGRAQTLQAARGSFCVAHVDTRARRVRLAIDKLALRPLHYAVVDGVLLFATSLRLLLILMPRLGERGDLGAQTQIAALGEALGPRTPYEGIRSLEGGQLIDIDAAGTHPQWYHRWDDVAPVEASPKDFGERLYAAFSDAIRLRLGSQSRVAAHVSGGLDSRCVVALLRDRGVEVDSINFAPEDSADLVLGRLAAQRLGTRHFEYSQGSTDFWERMLAAHVAWLDSLVPHQRPPQAARIWTGFAGETVLAPTNLTADIVQAMRAGRTDAAIAGYLRRAAGGALSTRLFLRSQRQVIAGGLRDAIEGEIGRRSNADPARRMHVYQLLNEPRGNLARHHEDIDLRRIEFTLPFCDAELVSTALSWQLEPLLQHRFYYAWLQHFPAAVREVAWQAYPWSLPCPVPPPSRRLRYQWVGDWIHVKERRAELHRLATQVSADMTHPRFPGHLLDRNTLRVACLLARCGVERYAYLLRHALVFSRFAIRVAVR